MRMAKAAASRNVEEIKPDTRASTMPRMMPPTMAPGMIPIPPRTAATKALMPGAIPTERINRIIIDPNQYAASSSKGRTQGKSHADDAVDIDAHQAGRIGVKGNSTHGLADFCIIDNIRQGQHEDNGTAKDDDLLAIDHKPPTLYTDAAKSEENVRGCGDARRIMPFSRKKIRQWP